MEIGTPSTQGGSESQNLFVDSSNAKLKIFLDIAMIQNRPKLIRTLRNYGAQICHNPGDAAILLVNATSVSGRRFSRDWSTEQNKVVLEYPWIQKCLTEGKALLSDDNWGGFRAIDDGGSIQSDEDDEEVEEVQKSPLPTPRPTPIGSHDGPSNKRRRTSAPLPRQQDNHPNIELSSTQFSPRDTTENQHPTMPPLGPISPPLPASSFSPMQFMSNPLSMNNIPSMSQMQPQMQPQMQSQMHHQMQFPNQFPFFPNNMLSMTPQFLFSNPTMPNPAFTNLLESAIALARQHGADTSQLQATLSSLSMFPQQQMGQPMFSSPNLANLISQQPAAGPSHPLFIEAPPPKEPQPMDASFHLDNRNEFDESSPFVTQSLPLKRRAAPPIRPQSSIMKDEQMAKSSSLSSRRNAASNAPKPSSSRSANPPPSIPANHPSSLLSLLSSQSAPTASSSPIQSPSPMPRQEGSVFRSSSGGPILLYVQVDLRSRRDVVQSIKRNGGKITADISAAAYAVLNPRSATYRDLRDEALRRHTPVVQAAFVNDCISEGELMDPVEYAVDDSSMPKRRGRKPKNPQKSKARPIPRKRKRRPVKIAVPHTPINRSPTPEPPTETKEMSGGRYYYTEAEWTYARMYIRRLLEVDSNMNLSHICIKLNEKMPHHSSGSWHQTIARPINIHIWEEVKAEVEMSLNGGPSTHVSAENPDDNVESPDAAAAEAAGSDGAEEEQLEQELAQSPEQEEAEEPITADADDASEFDDDYEAIVDFLSSAAADQYSEEEVWDVLSKRRVCCSAPSWQDFLEQHFEAVTTEIQRRCAEQRPANEATAPASA